MTYLLCVEWDVKPYTPTENSSSSLHDVIVFMIINRLCHRSLQDRCVKFFISDSR